MRADTLAVVTVKVADAAPAGTNTVVGTLAAAVLELASAIVTPAAPAGLLSVTVPVAVPPPVTLPGDMPSELSADAAAAGFTEMVAVRVAPKYDAVIVDELTAVTVPVVIANVAETEPDGTVTAAGTVAAAVSELKSETTTPALGAGALSVTAPVAV